VEATKEMNCTLCRCFSKNTQDVSGESGGCVAGPPTPTMVMQPTGRVRGEMAAQIMSLFPPVNKSMVCAKYEPKRILASDASR
jgi:hypothetical protein